jgi:hypothetical protein
VKTVNWTVVIIIGLIIGFDALVVCFGSEAHMNLALVIGNAIPAALGVHLASQTTITNGDSGDDSGE